MTARGQRKRAVAVDPSESAVEAGLRYVTDAMPGIRRRRAGKGFTYLDAGGRRITDRATLARIRSLAIPPAYADVWISPHPNGHIQATGRDARGRKQYRYHPRWREVRDETKFGRMLAFSGALPRIRKRVEQDLSRPGLPREKVLATVVRLLELTGIRVGNDEYARNNQSFGLTTLREDHVEVLGSTMRFEFRGKSGKVHRASLSDRRLARIVARCQSLPGEELFQYVDDEGVHQTIGSSDVNDYLREMAGDDFTAKDFRTWSGTLLALRALEELGPAPSEREAKSTIVAAIDRVAERLNNTRAICRKYYVHPVILEAYLTGTLLQTSPNGTRAAAVGANGLRPEEHGLVRLLRQSA
jgi:DNA topoisomerase I